MGHRPPDSRSTPLHDRRQRPQTSLCAGNALKGDLLAKENEHVKRQTEIDRRTRNRGIILLRRYRRQHLFSEDKKNASGPDVLFVTRMLQKHAY